MTGNRQAIRSREQMVHSFVREALEALAAPPVAVSILARAMRRSRIDALPHDGGDLSRFVENELIDEVEKSLGEAAAELIRGRLLPIIRRATDPSETSAVRGEARRWQAHAGSGHPLARYRRRAGGRRV